MTTNTKVNRLEKILTLDDFRNLRGKTVLLRADLNSPLEKRSIVGGKRFEAHAKTISLIAGKGAKVVVLAHQGRKGGSDFTNLAQHAKFLSKLCNKKILFKPDSSVVSPPTLDAVRKLKAGEILLLDNARFLAEEAEEKTPSEHARGKLVAALAPIADVYVNDAFSNSHRSHETMVGFPEVMASCAGPVLWHELSSATLAREQAKHPVVYLLGGAKPNDAMRLMEYSLKNHIVDKILTAGVIGELCLIARGNELPPATLEELRAAGHDKLLLQLRDLIHEYHENIETPFDFAFQGDEGKRFEMMLTACHTADRAIGDVGIKTYQKYGRVLAKARTIYIKGPLGKYELEPFQQGTRHVLQATVANRNAYTMIGGGHSGSASEKLGIPLTKFSFASLSGGALEEFMQGKPLPGIVALESAAKKFGAKPGAKKMPQPLPPAPAVHKTKQAKLK